MTYKYILYYNNNRSLFIDAVMNIVSYRRTLIIQRCMPYDLHVLLKFQIREQK